MMNEEEQQQFINKIKVKNINTQVLSFVPNLLSPLKETR
jgi:hypothetical protein